MRCVLIHIEAREGGGCTEFPKLCLMFLCVSERLQKKVLGTNHRTHNPLWKLAQFFKQTRTRYSLSINRTAYIYYE